MTENFRWQITDRFNNNSITDLEFDWGLHIIYGSAGTGKSDLAHLIAGLDHSSEPRWNLTGNIDKIRVQIVMQNPDLQILFPTVGEELSFNIECKLKDSAEIMQERDRFLQLPFMLKDTKRHPTTLSGGEKEVLNVVTAISSDPELLVIDDGLSFLSRELKGQVIKHLSDWCREENRCVLWFSSDITDLEFSNRKWKINEGYLQKVEILQKTEYQDVMIPQGKMSLDINNLTFEYDKEKIFSDFSFKAENVRSIGITGINGSGKTTLASLLSGILTPKAGSLSITINGASEFRTGYMDQFPERVMGLKTPEEFLDQLVIYGLFDRNMESVLSTNLNDFGIRWENSKKIPSTELPWTTTRLILNFMAALGNYNVLILDEPTFGLGWEQKCRLIDYYLKVMKQKYLIIISHDYEFIEKVCNVSCVVER